MGAERARILNWVGVGIIAGLLGELALRRTEMRRAASGYDYWRRYHSRAVLERGDAIRQVAAIRSTGETIHLDVYPHPDPHAPTVIFNHGGAGYGRLFVSLALRFYDRGYNVILPDQRGQGFSGGGRGDYTVSECTQNIVDAAHWAKQRFATPLFICGASYGGALTYYAAAAGAPANAIACMNLFDFSSSDILRQSSLAWIERIPFGLEITRFLMAALRPLDGIGIPAHWLARFDKLMDDRDALFQQQWDHDPIPPARLTLRQIASNITSPPAIPFAQNQMPTLVLNQALDLMIDPAITHRNYESLGGTKAYIEVPYGHWSNDPAFYDTFVHECDTWFQKFL